MSVHWVHILLILGYNKMCQCPEPLEPPNPKIKQCRQLLQMLCASLVVIGTFAILAGDIFGLINYLIYAYILYMAWTTFNWCILLLLFLFLFMQAIQVIIIFAGLIQYKQLFANKEVMISIYVILQVFFCPTAIFITHYVYRHFKNISHDMMGLGAGLFPPGQADNAPNQNQPQRQYYRAPEENTNTPNQTRNQTENNIFRGEGVRVG